MKQTVPKQQKSGEQKYEQNNTFDEYVWSMTPETVYMF